MKLRKFFWTNTQIERARLAAVETVRAAAVEAKNIAKFRIRRLVEEEATSRTPSEKTEAQLTSNDERRRLAPAV